MRLRLRHGHYIGSRHDLTETWLGGEERDVSAESAAYLLDTFADRFERVEVVEVVEVVAPAPAEPEMDRAIKSPRRGR